MAINDFTNQNIQDTYQKVVQTEGGKLADGTGSLLPISFEGNNVRISGSIFATEYSVTSSVTNVVIATKSGSTAFGDSIDDTHRFTGSLKTLGTGSFQYLEVDGVLQHTGDSGTDVRFSSDTVTIRGNSRQQVRAGGNRVDFGNINTPTGITGSIINVKGKISGITSSNGIISEGDISASNVNSTITGATASFHYLKGDTSKATGLEVAGLISAQNITASIISSSGNIIAKTITAADSILHKDDANTGIYFGLDTIQGKTNNLSNFSFSTTENRIGNASDPTNISGSTIGFRGDITSSGNIRVGREGILGTYADGGGEVQGVWGIGQSSNGTVYQISTANDNFGNHFGLGYAYNGNGGSITGFNHQFVLVNDGTVNGALSFDGHASLKNITASGDISASLTSTITAGDYKIKQNQLAFKINATTVGLVYENNTSIHVGRTGNAIKLRGNVTASGNISASGDVIASNVFMPAGAKISFDDDLDGSDQFIIGGENYITIDGDEFVKLRADNHVRFQDNSGNVFASINPNSIISEVFFFNPNPDLDFSPPKS